MRLFNTLFVIILTTLTGFTQINPQNIQIARDKWGVPHIFAKTDPEVANPNYADQMPLFLNQQSKKMTLDKAQVLKEAVKVYHPK